MDVPNTHYKWQVARCHISLQQWLELKLEPARAPVVVMVIDRVEKPSEN